jgi:hypothetical protein
MQGGEYCVPCAVYYSEKRVTPRERFMTPMSPFHWSDAASVGESLRSDVT